MTLSTNLSTAGWLEQVEKINNKVHSNESQNGEISLFVDYMSFCSQGQVLY